MRIASRTFLIAALGAAAALAQSTDIASGPKFEIAGVSVSPALPGPRNQFMRMMPLREGRDEIRTASIVDLIRTAYGFEPDKILGGPSWIEMDRFDIVAKAPADTSPDTLKEMTKTLLAERLQLVTHTETKQLPVNALTVGKKPQMKEADGTGDTGCRMQNGNGGSPGDGSIRLMSMSASGNATAINLGPNGIIQYSCRNMTMESFATSLRGMLGANVGPDPVLDHTGLAGKWNFDLKWSFSFNGPVNAGASERISLAEALDKQLGLKLEQVPNPTPVIVVDGVNRTPSANPPGVTEALPPLAAPTSFDVATIKPTDPDYQGGMMTTRGNTMTARGMPLQTFVRQAFANGGLSFSGEGIIGIPNFAESARFDITAKSPGAGQMDFAAAAPMMRSMLEDRFGMKWHTEERPMSAYTLVATKPKLKKADPASRTHCTRPPAPAGSPPGTQVLACQNMTMAQFVGQIPNAGPGLNWPVLDATGLEGGWDFTLTFGRGPVGGIGMPAPPPPPGGGEGSARMADMASASDPSGSLTLFEAIEKQLGLKLETQKRPEPVVVIDHLNEKPTEN